MVLLWLAFTAMLYVAEPLFLNRWFEKRAQLTPESTFARRKERELNAPPFPLGMR